jgi:hypothetical protein
MLSEEAIASVLENFGTGTLGTGGSSLFFELKLKG